MDQDAWNQIYADLERDIAAIRKRGGNVSELDVILEIDRARFAMIRGDGDEAIARIQALKRQLRGPDAASAITRSVPSSPSLDRLDALEDNVHATTRLGSARIEIVGDEDEPPTRAASQNTKVNKSIKYDDIKDELVGLWNRCQIRQEKASAVRREADRVVANRKIYEEISSETQVPWWFIGLIHGMECSFSLGKHLHNGDSLKARTWQVPAGRPKEGSPPFTFQESAIDALEVDGFAGKTDWPLAMVLFRLERYNGFGYRKKFGFASPYLWSYTNHFSSGKYVKDGVFDPNAVSKQCGAAAMLRDLVQRGIVSVEEKTPATAVVEAPKPAAAAAPPPPALAPAAPPAAPPPTDGTAPPTLSDLKPAAPAASPAPPAAPAPPSATPDVVAAPPPPSQAAPAVPPAFPHAAPQQPAAGEAASVKPVDPVPPAAAASPAVAAALAELARRPR